MTEREVITLGRRVTARRRSMGISARSLAKRIGVDHSWLLRVEAGAFAEPDAGKVTLLLEALDLSAGRRIDLELASRLPGMRTYFRTKFDLTPEQIEQVTGYVEDLRKRP